MTNRTDYRQGFSLIELIIVTAIIVIFFSMTLVNYGRSNNDVTVDRGVKAFVDILYSAKQRAETGQTDNCGTAVNVNAPVPTLRGYIVRQISTTSYVVEVSCSIAGNVVTNRLQQINLPPNLDIARRDALGGSLMFRPLSNGTNMAGNVIFRIHSSAVNSNNCVDVTITPRGIIQEGSKITC